MFTGTERWESTGDVFVEDEVKDLLKNIFVAREPRITQQSIHVRSDPRLQLILLRTHLTASSQT